MRKSILTIVVLLTLALTSCGRTSANASDVSGDLRPDYDTNKVVYETDYRDDYVVIDGPHMDEPVFISIEEYIDDSSNFAAYNIRYIDFSDLETLNTIDSWQDAAMAYAKTEEDALLLKYVSYLNELHKFKKVGCASVPLDWLDGLDFDFSRVNEARLQYKFEILAHEYGFTTRGRVGIDLESNRFWYNLYKLDIDDALQFEEATIL